MASVKSFSQDPAKKLWRERMVDFVRKHYTPNQIRNFCVLCFAGKEMAEVFDVYDSLGVKRKNVVSLESDVKEYEEQNKLNETLEQRIKVVPASALDYLSRQPAQTFDMISLDYCGYFNDEKSKTLDRIAHLGWLSSSGVIITNYQKGRENAAVRKGFERTFKLMSVMEEMNRMKSADMARFYLAIDKQEVADFDISATRDRVIQVIPIQKMFNGTGFWNAPIFRTWLKFLPLDTQEEVMTCINEVNDGQIKQTMSFLARAFEEAAPDSLTHAVQGLITFSETRQHYLVVHEAYSYVSDSGTPMISDFYVFKEMLMPFLKQQRVGKVVGYKLKDGSLAFDIHDKGKMQQLLLDYLKWHTENMPKYYEQALLPVERINLNNEVSRAEDGNDNDNGYNEGKKSERTAGSNNVREQVYTALSSSTPDEEIMSIYELSKPQLAGYKAGYAKRNNCNAANRNGKNILPEDLEVIDSLLADGYKATEIVQLFEENEGKPKYSWQSIAVHKALLTRTKAAAEGALSNERFFERLKPEILRRDNHICQWCSASAEEQQKRSGHAFHVHHINYDHEDTRRENLVTLCTSCHARTNTMQHGSDMKEYFELLMEEKYSVVKA